MLLPFQKPADQIGVLVSSAGRRVELLNCLREGAGRIGRPIRIIAGDLRPELSAACHSADHSVQFPRACTAEFSERMLEVCQKEDIHLVIPTIDTELLAIAQLKPQLRGLGVTPAVSSPDVVRMARDKASTAQALAKVGIRTPGTLPLSGLKEALDRWGLPLIAKPIDGSNSQGLRRLTTLKDLEGLPADRSGYLVQEWVHGREFTVNFLMDRESKILSAVPHERLEVRGGEVSKGRTTFLPQVEALLPKLELALNGGFGPLCFQAILTPDSEVVVFEINARFGGGYPLTHKAGARFTQWLMESATGTVPKPIGDWTRDLTMLRYDAAVFSNP